MSMALDPVGNVSLILQVAILFILVLGLPLSRGQGAKKNLSRHGYLAVFALVLHAILIFIVMIPSFVNGVADFADLSLISLINVLSHAILGTAAEIIGIIIVALWFSKPLRHLACYRAKKWMWPLFIIWAISYINGAVIHILGMI